MIPALTVVILAAYVLWLRRRLAQANQNNEFLRRQLHMCRTVLMRARRA